MPHHVVDIWWSDLRVMDRRLLPLLDPVEAARAAGLEGAADLGRFVVGAVLLRVAVGRTTGRHPWSVAVDRTCDDCGRPHGRPAVEGVHVSVAHAGPLVLVATAAGPVGVDVESARRGPDVAEWVRQEAAFKAHGSRDGDGLHVQPLVTPLPGHAAALALTRPGEVVVHDPDESSAALAAARGQAPRSAR